jgi:hypothetical protein
VKLCPVLVWEPISEWASQKTVQGAIREANVGALRSSQKRFVSSIRCKQKLVF